jgi:hypothetical protein
VSEPGACVGLCRRIPVRYTILLPLSLTNRNASMISVVVQNFIFDVHDARRAFATGPTAHAAPKRHRARILDVIRCTI